MNTRNCECCLGRYATGKNYGDYWFEIPMKEKIFTDESDATKILYKLDELLRTDTSIDYKYRKYFLDKIPPLFKTVEPKGLCEFCNPAEDNIWYNHRPFHCNESCRKPPFRKLGNGGEYTVIENG